MAISMVKTGSASAPRFAILDSNKCEYKKDYLILSDDQVQSLKSKYQVRINNTIVRRFSVKCPKIQKSHAFVFSDRVRTHSQSLIVWTKKDKVLGIDTLEFYEPKKYKAPVSWLELIKNKDLKNMHTVDALSGATLTRQSTLRMAKSALALETINE